MKRKRRNHSASFKAKVAVAAIRGDKTLAELSEQFDVHQNQEWRRKLLDQADQVFGRGGGSPSESEHKLKELHAKIGQLTMERDFHMAFYFKRGKYIPRLARTLLVQVNRILVVRRHTGLQSTMDQAHIRGLATAFHSSVVGLPLS